MIIGGKDNTVLATGGTILGGLNNKSKGLYSLIGGGKNNTIVGGRTGQIIL
ncbi:MAG: hypothetical protein LBI53_07335 [Candidatus Peribacteria bacterium]|nr:hypothetical protein [Candidatus Peribacteria bacterium]